MHMEWQCHWSQPFKLSPPTAHIQNPSSQVTLPSPPKPLCSTLKSLLQAMSSSALGWVEWCQTMHMKAENTTQSKPWKCGSVWLDNTMCNWLGYGKWGTVWEDQPTVSMVIVTEHLYLCRPTSQCYHTPTAIDLICTRVDFTWDLWANARPDHIVAINLPLTMKLPKFKVRDGIWLEVHLPSECSHVHVSDFWMILE